MGSEMCIRDRAGIYGIVAIAALVLIVPNFIKTKGKVINYVEED